MQYMEHYLLMYWSRVLLVTILLSTGENFTLKLLQVTLADYLKKKFLIMQWNYGTIKTSLHCTMNTMSCIFCDSQKMASSVAQFKVVILLFWAHVWNMQSSVYLFGCVLTGVGRSACMHKDILVFQITLLLFTPIKKI